jgi:hypothetical protein
MADECPYRSPHCTGAADSREHAVPQDIGGNFWIPTCEACNRAAAKYIDNPLLADGDVRLLRATYDVRSPKRRSKVATDQFVGKLEDGARALFRPGPSGGELKQVTAGEPIVNEDGTFTISASGEHPEEQLERGLKKLREENPGKTVELESTEARTGEVNFEHSWGLGPWIWPRFAAKVALAMASRTIPGFAEERPAKLLRALIWQLRVHKDLLPAEAGLGAVPSRLEPNDPAVGLLLPHEHLISLSARSGELVAAIVLFGELGYALRIATDLQPENRTVAWLVDGHGQPASATLDLMVGELARRAEINGDARLFRQERPRSELRGVIGRGTTE